MGVLPTTPGEPGNFSQNDLAGSPTDNEQTGEVFSFPTRPKIPRLHQNIVPNWHNQGEIIPQQEPGSSSLFVPIVSEGPSFLLRDTRKSGSADMEIPSEQRKAWEIRCFQRLENHFPTWRYQATWPRGDSASSGTTSRDQWANQCHVNQADRNSTKKALKSKLSLEP